MLHYTSIPGGTLVGMTHQAGGERNQVVRHVIEYGLDGWKVDVDYHRRSLVENTFFRLKTIFGERLKSRTEANQLTEQKLKALIINQFNSLGLPRYSGTS